MKIRHCSTLLKLALLVPLFCIQPMHTASAEDGVSSSQQQIINGGNDSSGPRQDAVVYLSTGCTGTLISTDIVLTAGHCFAAHATAPSGVSPAGRCDWETPGRWYEFPNHWTDTIPSVSFGRDRSSPELTVDVIAYSIPDCTDMMALRLENPVPRDIAIPVNVVTSNQAIDSIAGIDLAGWGLNNSGSSPTIRQIGSGSGPFDLCSSGDAIQRSIQLCSAGASPQAVRQGDSGGPIFRQGTKDLIGVVQGFEGGGGQRTRFTVTFLGDDLTDSTTPRISPWLSRLLDCASYRDESLPQPEANLSNTVPLFNWWSASRLENFASSDSRWRMNVQDINWGGNEHIDNGLAKEGYTAYRWEGSLFDPMRSQPAGTKPLYSWWSSARNDNFASSDPRWAMDSDDIVWNGEHIANGPAKEGYTLYRLEGYLFDPKLPQPPGTKPLYSWWSPSRSDNFTSSDPRWVMDPDDIVWNGEHIANGPSKEGYTLYRLEGYLVDRRVVSEYCEISE